MKGTYSVGYCQPYSRLPTAKQSGITAVTQEL